MMGPTGGSQCTNPHSAGRGPFVKWMLQGSPLKRQLKHLNNRKEQPDRRPRPRASESGGDVGVRARDAGDAPGRVGETRGAPGGVGGDCTRRSPSFADSSGSVASVPCSNTNV